MKERTLGYALFTAAAAFFIGLCFTSTDFLASPVAGAADVALLVAQWGVVVAAVYGLLLLLAANRYVFALGFPLLTLTSAILAYFRYSTRTTLTAAVWDAALGNDLRTSAELVTPGLLLGALLALLLAGGFVFLRWRFVHLRRPWIPLAGGLALLLGLTSVQRLRRPISERIPLNVYYTWRAYQKNRQVAEAVRPPLTQGLQCGTDSLTLVLVLGESLRPDHLGFNGYARNTTPRLDKEDLISFPHVYSEATYTNLSIPRLLTRADSSDYGRAYREPSFISLLHACGYATAWLADQETAPSYAYFTKECDTLLRANIGKSPYVFSKWLDGDLLPFYERLLSRPLAKQFILLHCIGSHWWYNAHYPDSLERFRPVAQSRIVSSNTKQEMINAYDNTVLYTDFFLSQLIDSLRGKKAVLIYQSDHGEALGEEGRWLHAVDAPPVHSAACFLWMSPAYKAACPQAYARAKANRLRPYRSDYLFHTVLDLCGIRSPYLQTSLSLIR